MTFTFKQTFLQHKLRWLSALMLFPLLITLLLAQNVRADGLDVEAVVVRAERQQVDVDGDGRLETFSADYTVYDDGTADGVVYIDNETVDIQRGDFGLTADGDVYVAATGVLRHEVGHTLGFRHEHTRPSASGGDVDVPDILIWDIDFVTVTHSVMIDTNITYR